MRETLNKTIWMILPAVLLGAALVGFGFWLGHIGNGDVSRFTPEQSESHGQFGTRMITVDVGKFPSPDCWAEVNMRDDDGKPGGSKTIHTETLCP